MTWTNHVGAGAAYTVVRVVNGASVTLTTAATTGWTDSSAPAGAAIAYRVYTRACNLNGCSNGYAAILNVTTHPLGSDPVGHASGAAEPCYYDCPMFPGYFSIGGSALDFDTTAPIQVRLVSDGVPTGTVAASSADSSNSQYPGYGNDHGFLIHWLGKSPLKGTHQTCAVAVNVAGGNDHNIGCYSYTTPGAPVAASNLVAAVHPTNVVVTFTDNANDESGYYLQRSTDGGTSWLQVGTEYPPVAGSGTRSSVTDNSSVLTGTCYAILMTNQYGQTRSAPACTS